MRSSLLAATMIATALCLSVPVLAAGGGGGGMETPAAKPVDPNFARAKAMIEARDYQNALPLLQQVIEKDPKSADAYNLMGFATRSMGNAQGSLQYYQQALTIDPRHIGAHEYAGTAYLILGRLPEAEQHLARLDSLCTFGCAEYRTLKAKIADYKAGKRPTN
jgi:tetratricopeptide (TPR) repeat protein